MDTDNSNTRSGRRRRSASERRKLLDAYHSSGLSQAAFCRKKALHPATFSKWVQKGAAQRKQGRVFREVLVMPDVAEEVSLHLPGGIKLTSSAAVAVKLIRELSSC